MSNKSTTRGPSKSLAAVVGLAVAAILMAGAPPAQAAAPKPATLCKSFKQCTARHHSNFGYAKVYRSTFWSMRRGHNCTNYVAFRLTHGRLVARPPGSNSASTWGAAARAAGVKVDGKPSRGAVAWWGTGTKSHVAYVEKVEASGAVIISEDNLGGDFKWRRIVRKTSGWPTGFIHYPASNGSPFGVFTSVSSLVAGKVDLRGSSSDPNGGSRIPTYLVTIGGPRGTAGIESFTFATQYFNFHWIKTVHSRGTKTIYLYALNTPRTTGSDVLIGRKTLTVR